MIALLAGGALVAVAAVSGALLLRLRGLVSLVLGVGVLGASEVVAVSHVTSFFDAYTRGWVLASLAAIAIAAVGAVAVARPTAPALAHVRPVAGELLRDPVAAVLGAVVLLELGYATALALFTPPTEYDVLTYHLTRAILWIQQHSIGAIPGVRDVRINDFPPDAEILQGATMLLSGSIRYVGLVQLSSLVGAVLAIYGTAGRIGLSRAQAAFGALLFPTLTVVALQAPSALNDLMPAALVVTAAYFALGRSWAELTLGGLALALLVGTKGTGLLAVPILLVVCLLTHRGSRLAAVLGIGAAAIAVGGAWYLLVDLRGGRGLFGTADESTVTSSVGSSSSSLLAIPARTTRYLVETVDVPAGGRTLLLYALAAGAVLVVGLIARRRTIVVVGAALTLVPIAFPFTEHVLHAVYWHGWTTLGYPRATTYGATRGAESASSLASWYGPVGLGLTLASLVVVTWRAARRTMLPVAAVLAWAPLVVLVGTAVLIGYHPFDGRYVMGGVALGVTTWGVVRAFTAASAAVVAVAATTVLLAFVNDDERPSGIGLLEPSRHSSIWTLPRAWSQSIQPEVSRMIEYLDAHAVDGSTVAVTRDWAVYPFTYVGWPRIEHRLVYADTLEEASRGEAAWAVVPADVACAPGWELALRSEQWAVYRQVPGAACR